MKWKWLAGLTLAVAFSLGPAASAYDLPSLAKTVLPKTFTYKDIPGTASIHFAGNDIPYHLGQLQVLFGRRGSFASGYILSATMPGVLAEQMNPFFRLNPSGKEWHTLAALNRELLDEDSGLRQNIASTLMALAVNSVGPLAENNVQVDIREIEPFRRLSSDEAFVFTAGGLAIYHSQGLVLPMYCRAYFFPGNDGLQVLMLFTPDEGKEPLIYAIDDLAKAAAKQNLLESRTYKDLGSVLAQAEEQ